MHLRKPHHPRALPTTSGHFLTPLTFWVTTRGRSMWPVLRSGQTIPFEPIDASCLRAGDVVLYGPPEASAIHRLSRPDNNGWWIMDDASLLPPHWIAASDIRGRWLGWPQAHLGYVWGKTCRFIFQMGRTAKSFFIK